MESPRSTSSRSTSSRSTISWRPNISVETMQQRSELLKSIRRFFDARGFFEVQTPVLSRDTVVDRFIEPIAVEIPGMDRSDSQLWMQTSPEFFMKRVVAAGAEKIFQIGPVFRGAEQGDFHNIEFTMLEWYRVGDTYEQGMDLLDEFSQALLGIGAAQRLTYREAFKKFAKVDPFDEPAVAQRAASNGTDHDENLNRLLVEKVEAGLAQFESVIIYDWPGTQSALAHTRQDGDSSIAERFELYIQGIELANGYHELDDAEALLTRNRTVNEMRNQDGKQVLPEESHLLSAMREGFPNCCGVALGIDRLVMLALGKKKISEVMAFDFRNA